MAKTFWLVKLLEKKKIIYENLCILDADILVNPFAPNIFDYHDTDKISVVSSRINMPNTIIIKQQKRLLLTEKVFIQKYPLNKITNKYVYQRYFQIS